MAFNRRFMTTCLTTAILLAMSACGGGGGGRSMTSMVIMPVDNGNGDNGNGDNGNGGDNGGGDTSGNGDMNGNGDTAGNGDMNGNGDNGVGDTAGNGDNGGGDTAGNGDNGGGDTAGNGDNGGGDMGADEVPSELVFHVIQVGAEVDDAVSASTNSSGAVALIYVGDTHVSAVFPDHILLRGGVSGGGNRRSIGDILQNDNIRVRHVTTHWDLTTDADAVTRYDHLTFGAWAVVEEQANGNAGFGYQYTAVGDGYLIGFDDTRTPIGNMPVAGTAAYKGQYTGFSQRPGVNGDIRKETGDITLSADFSDSSIELEFGTPGTGTSLAGTIGGNTFSGTQVKRIRSGSIFEAEGATAMFQGGFYGDEMGEAGGVFEIVGNSLENPPRVAGAFGGIKTE